MSKQGNKTGILYLIPTSLGEEDIDHIWPAGHRQLVDSLDIFIVENVRTARRFLRRAGYTKNFDGVIFNVLDKRTADHDLLSFLQPNLSGCHTGLLSEAGSPCIADPGQKVVALAHKHHIRVTPLTGPSSIMLALMASGMNGQHFQFHGYLPIEKSDRLKKIREIEDESMRTGVTQIFMETPYRNNALVEDLTRHCKPGTQICIAADLTRESEYILTQSAAQWKQSGLPQLHKRPAIFLLWA